MFSESLNSEYMEQF